VMTTFRNAPRNRAEQFQQQTYKLQSLKTRQGSGITHSAINLRWKFTDKSDEGDQGLRRKTEDLHSQCQKRNGRNHQLAIVFRRSDWQFLESVATLPRSN